MPRLIRELILQLTLDRHSNLEVLAILIYRWPLLIRSVGPCRHEPLLTKWAFPWQYGWGQQFSKPKMQTAPVPIVGGASIIMGISTSASSAAILDTSPSKPVLSTIPTGQETSLVMGLNLHQILHGFHLLLKFEFHLHKIFQSLYLLLKFIFPYSCLSTTLVSEASE